MSNPGRSAASPTGPTAKGTSASSGATATATSSASTRRPGSRAPTSARRRRPGRRDGRPAAARTRGAGLPERDSVRHPFAAIVVRDKVIHGSHVADRRITKEACRAGCALGRPHRRARLGLPHRAQQRRRVRGRHLAEPVVALLGQRPTSGRCSPATTSWATSICRPERRPRLLRRRPARRQPVLGNAHRRRRGDRAARVALPGRSTTACGTTTSRPIRTWWT